MGEGSVDSPTRGRRSGDSVIHTGMPQTFTGIVAKTRGEQTCTLPHAIPWRVRWHAARCLWGSSHGRTY